MSHGSGGTAADLVWIAQALAGRGFLVAAVEHHGNNLIDEPLLEGFSFWWERAADLSLALDHLAATERIGAATVLGYSLGGFTAAALLGARVDPNRYRRLRAGEPVLPIPPERPDIGAELAELDRIYGAKTLRQRALADYRDSRFTAAVLLAPAICPILQDSSLAAIEHPVLIRWGDADDIEPPETNGRRYARLIPGADGRSLGPHVGHLAFCDNDADGTAARAEALTEIVDFCRRTGAPVSRR
jgi:predicted dienelactone hydrolase